MSELWVARDADGRVGFFGVKPRWFADRTWVYPETSASPERIPGYWFPDLKPGECRRLVMEKEKSE